MYIYKITNLINGRCYIGQTTKSLEVRWRYHNYKSSECKYISNALQKYGKENFKIEILLCVLKKEYLDCLEEEFIKNYKCLSPSGYNIQSGGTNKDSMRGRKHSEETKKKMSIKASGKNNSQYGKRGFLSPNYKVKKSKEHIEKVAKKHRKKVFCKELDKTWDSLKECAEYFNTRPSSICNAIYNINRVKRYKGFTFVYVKGSI